LHNPNFTIRILLSTHSSMQSWLKLPLHYPGKKLKTQLCFFRLDFSSILIRHKNGSPRKRSSNRGFENHGCVLILAWMEIILKTQLFDNDEWHHDIPVIFLKKKSKMTRDYWVFKFPQGRVWAAPNIKLSSHVDWVITYFVFIVSFKLTVDASIGRRTRVRNQKSFQNSTRNN